MIEDFVLENYVVNGFRVFPLLPNSKVPMIKNGCNGATTDKAQIIRWWQQTTTANVGIATGKASGVFVLDVDVKGNADGVNSLKKLCEKFGELPETLIVQTPSGGFHYYFKQPEMDIRCSAGKLGNGIDVRADGGYIVAPPSCIDSKAYKLISETVEMAELPLWLIELCTAPKKAEKKSGSSGVHTGGRNKHVFNLACRCRAEDLPIEEARALILDEALKCTPPLPEEEALRTVDSAYRYPAGNNDTKVMDELNASHFVVMVGGNFRVANIEDDPVRKCPSLSLSSSDSFRNRYRNRKVQLGENNVVTLGNYWLDHPQRRECRGIVFEPCKESPEYHNLWQGFNVEPRKGDCRLFLDHILKNIANGDKDIFRYIIAWLAIMFQSPRVRVGVALVLRGKQGTGKGVFVNQIGKLLGSHYVYLSNQRHLTGNFNAHLATGLLVFADEAFWAGSKQSEGVLKSLITEEHLTIEKKGQDAIHVNNYIHLMVASNDDWVVPAGFEERRFCVLDVGDARQQDHEYFEAIVEQMDDGGREALLYFLLNYDISGVNIRKFPQTEALFENKLLSMGAVEQFWYGKLMSGALNIANGTWNDGVVSVSLLYNDFIQFSKDIGGKYRKSTSQFGIALRALLPSKKIPKKRIQRDGSREYAYEFPSLEKCRNHFEGLMNYKIDWSDGDDHDVGNTFIKTLEDSENVIYG